MDKEEIKDYLKRVDELGAKLTGEDKETYTWLIYGCNQCAKLLNETEQQCKKQKEVINKITSAIQGDIDGFLTINEHGECNDILELLEIYLDILKEVSE